MERLSLSLLQDIKEISMTNDETTLGDLVAYFGIVLVCFAAIYFLLSSNQQVIPIEQSIDEAVVIANIVDIEPLDIPESEPLPEIVFNDPILPRALPPLVEGGDVYFEEL